MMNAMLGLLDLETKITEQRVADLKSRISDLEGRMGVTTTTSTDYPVGVELSYTTATSTSYPIARIDSTITNRHLKYPVQQTTEYICNYCGTRYVFGGVGFIPKCENCGAHLDKENRE